MKLTATQKWRRSLLWLHRTFPPVQGKVVVKSHVMKNLHGYTTFSDGDIFYVHINRDGSFNLRVDTVIHEWAHVLTWFGAGQHDDHSAEWGVAYARIYRKWCDWNYGRPTNNNSNTEETLNGQIRSCRLYWQNN